MLYSVQTLFPPLLFSALAFAKLTLPSVQKYVALHHHGNHDGWVF